jgi:hypothetical protein
MEAPLAGHAPRTEVFVRIRPFYRFRHANQHFKDPAANRLNLFRAGGDNPDHRAKRIADHEFARASRTPASNGSAGRRIATAVVLGTLVFTMLWITMFSLVTSLLIGTACCVVIVAASSQSDVVEMLLDAVASVIFGIVAVIAAIFGAIFSVFGF